MNKPALTRQDALERIALLAEEHGLSAAEIIERIEGERGSGGRGGERLIRRILAYLGSLFVLAGAVAAVDLFWDDLGSPGRVLASLGSGLVILLLAIAAWKDGRYEAAPTPLFLLSALLQTTGLFVFLEEYFSGGDPTLGAMAVFSVMTVQSVLFLVLTGRTSLAFLSVAFGFAFSASALAWLDIDAAISALVLGVSGLLVSWRVHATEHRAITPLTFFVFASLVAFGAFDLLEGAFPFDFLLVGVAAGMVYGGVLAHSRSLLVAGVLAMLGYLGYFTGEYFANLLSWPVALILMGLLMLGLSSYAVKLGRGIRSHA